MQEMSFEDTKKVELEILCHFADFCTKHKLRYFLAYGTLIGAIRHKGFIPWDDDIDIWMPRDDYNTLILNFNKNNNVYSLISPKHPLSRHSFTKIINTKTIKIEEGIEYPNGNLGVDIDIFPLDGQPENLHEYTNWYSKLQKQYKKYVLMTAKNDLNLKRKILLPILKTIYLKKNNIIRRTQLLHDQYPYKTSNYIGSIESCFNLITDRFKKEWFDEAINVEFEGQYFSAPKNYHEILTQRYGNYMELPAEDERITHHKNKSYYL